MTTTAPPRPELPELALRGLAEELGRVWGDPSLSLTDHRVLSAGASRLSWALTLTGPSGRREVVVQRERVRGQGRSEVQAEAAALAAAKAAGVPVPAVQLTDPEGTLLDGACIVTDLIRGETVPRRILRRPDLATARERFAEQCGHILARIHAIDPVTVPGLLRQDPLAAIREMLDGTGDPRPAFELALCWLEDHPPPARAERVVHGDFRNGNLIVDRAGVQAVLDWELTHLGNPIEDLGWLCMPAWRWGGPGEVGGVGERAELLAAYAAAGGGEVDVVELAWWELLAVVRWGVMCLEQARTHLSGEHRSVELAVLGRKAVEMEQLALGMLGR